MFCQSQHPTARRDFLGRVKSNDLLYGVDTCVRATYLSNQGRVNINGRNRTVEFSGYGPQILLPRHAMKEGTVVRNPKKHAVLVFDSHDNVRLCTSIEFTESSAQSGNTLPFTLGPRHQKFFGRPGLILQTAGFAHAD